jgi:hypothetical protein
MSARIKLHAFGIIDHHKREAGKPFHAPYCRPTAAAIPSLRSEGWGEGASGEMIDGGGAYESRLRTGMEAVGMAILGCTT